MLIDCKTFISFRYGILCTVQRINNSIFVIFIRINMWKGRKYYGSIEKSLQFGSFFLFTVDSEHWECKKPVIDRIARNPKMHTHWNEEGKKNTHSKIGDFVMSVKDIALLWPHHTWNSTSQTIWPNKISSENNWIAHQK